MPSYEQKIGKPKNGDLFLFAWCIIRPACKLFRHDLVHVDPVRVPAGATAEEEHLALPLPAAGGRVRCPALRPDDKRILSNILLFRDEG